MLIKFSGEKPEEPHKPETILMAIEGSGDSIILHLIFTTDEYFVYPKAKQPVCECGCEMHLIGNVSMKDHFNWPDGDEIWRCPFCGEVESFFSGEYGTIETEVSEDEWYDEVGNIRQRNYLRRRYDTSHPASIRDYWLANPASD